MQPKWIKVGKPWNEFRREFTEAFGFTMTGILIRVKPQDKKMREFLVGDINCNGGVCDDCMDFRGSDIVVSYCRIWTSKHKPNVAKWT